MFLHRLFSTVLLLGIFSSMIFAPVSWRSGVFYVVLVGMTSLLIREIVSALKNIQIRTHEKLLPVLGGFCMAFNGIYIFFPGSYMLYFTLIVEILTGTAVSILLLLLAKNDPEKIKKLLYSLMVLILVQIPILLVEVIFCMGNAGTFNWLILYFILMTKIGDIGAYVTGTLSNKILKGGNHKMIPSVSPGKSWEGMVGGLIITILFGLLLNKFCMVYTSPVLNVAASVLFFFGGMVGDLAESSFKRACSIKDSGHIFPGIGGIYDLVDSLFMTAPLFLFFEIIRALLERAGF
ncbi:MAG: phosphatidate cytidylyltransferase [Lentisphaeria bacterium]|nr:phosphatidate cytidylyltransferase [Lentisphaeria bacterium]